MKKILAVVLALILALSLFGCEQNSTTSSGNSAIISPDEITADTIAFLGVLNNVTWESGDDVDTYMYYAFYRDYINSITTPQERQRLYIHPEYESGFSYPQDEFEAYVQKYFDVSVEHLRDSDCYESKIEAYYCGGGGGNIKYKVRFPEEDAIKIDGDTAFVKAELSMMGDFSDTECRVYTLKKVDGGFKYISNKPIEPSNDPTILQDVNTILSDLTPFFLISRGFENTKEIDISHLTMWYGYLLRSQGKSGTTPDGYYHPVFPKEEFESAVYNYFGIKSDVLRKSQCYVKKYDGYALDTGLGQLVNHFYEITDVSLDGNVYKINFDLTVYDNDPYACVLTAEKTDNGFRFISYVTNESIRSIEVYAPYCKKYAEAFGTSCKYGFEWDSAEDLPSDNLVGFYYHHAFPLYFDEHPTEERYLSVPAEVVESFIKKYFDVSEEHLRKSTKYNYNPDSNTYSFDIDMGFGGAGGRVSHFFERGEFVDVYCRSSADEITDKGYYVLTLKETADGRGFKYVSARIEIPLQ